MNKHRNHLLTENSGYTKFQKISRKEAWGCFQNDHCSRHHHNLQQVWTNDCMLLGKKQRWRKDYGTAPPPSFWVPFPVFHTQYTSPYHCKPMDTTTKANLERFVDNCEGKQKDDLVDLWSSGCQPMANVEPDNGFSAMHLIWLFPAWRIRPRELLPQEKDWVGMKPSRSCCPQEVKD